VIRDFRAFVTKSNAMALAVGVIAGAAVGNVVSAVVSDLLMPIVGLVLPSGGWRDAKIVLTRGVDATGKATENAILYGHLLGTLIDFVIVMLVVYLLLRTLMREPPPEPTRQCPECLETLPLAARRCRACAVAIV
jgi:large conductance mechanosensitive channel